jgi:GNAT superfamily N-acetyltransferase
MYNIKFIPKENLTIILPFLQMLNEKTEEEILRNRIVEMGEYNYRCIGIFDGEQLIGISGLWILYKFYIGKHIEPDNVVVHQDYRGKGAGEALMRWIHDYARETGCHVSELNCYVKNTGGLKFWLQQGYRILGFHMRKDLDSKEK